MLRYRCCLSLLTGLLAAACSAPPTVEPPVHARHIVLVTVDTLRADHLGAYGGDFSTPALDRLAAAGAMFRHATAHVPLTRPSHVALMTGRLPTLTGIRDNVSPAVVPDVPLLAEVLEDAGFQTAGFVSSVVLTAASGLGRGFSHYEDKFEADPEDPGFLDSAQKRGDLTLAEATAWLEEAAAATETGGRLFLWLHLYDPHDPYAPPEPWASQFIDRPYAGEVAFTDSLIDQLDRSLARLQLADDTLLVVTSDHGEALGDHGERTHGFFVYQSTLHVPLLVRGPGIRAGSVIEQPVGLVDLYPTILDLAGVAPGDASSLSGRSLASGLLGTGTDDATPVYAESLVAKLHYGWSDLRVVRDGRFKLIDAPRPELYDVVADPREATNLLGSERRRFQAMQDRLGAFRAEEDASEAARAGTSADVAAAQASLRAELAALGYVGGTPTNTADPGADPKDKLAVFERANIAMRRGLEAQRAGDHGEAITAFESIAADGVDSAELRLYLGRSLLSLGRNKDAAAAFERTLAAVPAYAGAWLGLAEALIQLGDTAAADRTLGEARSALPRQAALAREHGRLLRRLSRLPEALAAFRAGLELAAGDAALYALLGESLRDTGDLDGALGALRRAAELAPRVASYWNVLGMTLANAGDLAGAEPAFREALRLDAGDPRHAFNLGLALLYQQRTDEARRLFETAADLGFAPAREHLRQLGPSPGS